MADLNVSKATISGLLTLPGQRKYVIPDYQRPYKWDIDKCQTLWQDLTSFFEEQRPDLNSDAEYYLGTIVTCASNLKSGNREVIDGQQRLTTFFLLLRAFYKKLEGMPSTDLTVIGLKSQIAPCIWEVNAITQQVDDPTKIRIESHVATADDNNTFHEILRTGIAADKATDLYSQNYRFFLSECNSYAQAIPLRWEALCVSILKNCIILPIECGDFDRALDIFSTLNDRGMPLSDSDIFKARIYKGKADGEPRTQFTAAWKQLTETVARAKLSLDDIFRYYTHVIRARAGDKGKEIGLRKFYAGKMGKFEHLHAGNLMADLQDLANFWTEARSPLDSTERVPSISLETRKLLHCFTCYPNDYWKYITSVYYFANRELPDFDLQFCDFLRKLMAYMFVKFLEKPTVNAIKDPCFQFCVNVHAQNPLSSRDDLPSDFRDILLRAHGSWLSRALVLLHAYLNPNQKSLLPSNFQTEHIFPRQWQANNYYNWTEETAKEFLDNFGNYVAIEAKLNAKVNNDYFARKKKQYAATSKVANVLALAAYDGDAWLKEDILAREAQFASDICNFFSEHFISVGLS